VGVAPHSSLVPRPQARRSKNLSLRPVVLVSSENPLQPHGCGIRHGPGPAAMELARMPKKPLKKKVKPPKPKKPTFPPPKRGKDDFVHPDPASH
jgi:hypothetical protein